MLFLGCIDGIITSTYLNVIFASNRFRKISHRQVKRGASFARLFTTTYIVSGRKAWKRIKHLFVDAAIIPDSKNKIKVRTVKPFVGSGMRLRIPGQPYVDRRIEKFNLQVGIERYPVVCRSSSSSFICRRSNLHRFDCRVNYQGVFFHF